MIGPAYSKLVIHNNADLFSSTMATLDPIFQPGSVLISDEFSNPLHEWGASTILPAFRRPCRVLGAAGEYYTQVGMELQ